MYRTNINEIKAYSNHELNFHTKFPNKTFTFPFPQNDPHYY